MPLRHAVDHALHGLPHWLRVERDGLELAAAEGGDPAVVSLFALFHDSRRLNDDADPDHGSRGAKLAEELHADERVTNLPVRQQP